MDGQALFSGSSQACRGRGRDVAQSSSLAWRSVRQSAGCSGSNRPARHSAPDGWSQAEGDFGRVCGVIVTRIRNDDFTLHGLVAELAGRGLEVDYHSVEDFLHAERLIFKKA